jgi:hypothetical protein
MASLTGLVINKFVAIGDNSGQTEWEGFEPIDRSVFVNIEAGHIAVWDTTNGVSDIYTFGGVNSVYDITAPASGNTYTVAALINANVRAVDRNGIGVKLVSGSPANGEIAFDSSTGEFELGPDDAFGSEWLRIWYNGIPTIGI